MGDEVDKAAVERYVRAVDHGLRERVGAVDRPLVLALTVRSPEVVDDCGARSSRVS